MDSFVPVNPLDRLFERLGARSDPKLLIHVHGGLVSAAAARADAHRLNGLDAYGPLMTEGWETSYLIWRTGLIGTIEAGLLSLRSDSLFLTLRSIVRRWLGRKAADIAGLEETLVAKSATMSDIEAHYFDAEFLQPPEIEARLDGHERACVEGEAEPAPGDSLYDELASDPAMQVLSQQAQNAMIRRRSKSLALQTSDEIILASLEKLDPEVRSELDLQYTNKSALSASRLFNPLILKAAKAGYRCIKRARSGRHHGFQATIVEEISRGIYADLIGSRIWGQMKDFAANHFTADGAGMKVLAKLKALADHTDGQVRLLFVGHSAGAILACDLIAAAGQLPGNVSIEVVLLAPAVRMDEAASKLAVAEARVHKLRIFTMSDEREKADALDGKVPFDIYPRSLLYLISGILERNDHGKAYADAPLLGLQRHISILGDNRLTAPERASRGAIAHYLASEPSRMIFAQSKLGDGLSTDAHSHGTIDSDPDTLASIRHIALSGF